MSSCCSDETDETLPCTVCGNAGPVVGTATVQPHRPDATEGDWRHCQTSDCPVIFYLDDQTVRDNEVITQVGNKAPAKPVPVCFCFAHTASYLADDLAANNGVSTAKAAVKAAVAEGLCACEHLNPSGQCCLADIHRTIKASNNRNRSPPEREEGTSPMGS